MEQLRALIGKKVINHNLSADEIIFHTACGETIRILSKELEGWSEFSFNHAIERLLKEHRIHNISIYPNETIFYFENGSRGYIFTSGIKKIANIKKSNNGLELLLTIETNSGREIDLHYLKTSDRWTMAEFNQHIEQEYLILAKKHDIINHPSVRIKTLV
jgi:hypothetical protein